MGSITRKFTLDDGSVWTTGDLSLRIGISHSSAYYRLNKSTDPTIVLKPRDKVKVTSGLKLYKLDDGSEVQISKCPNDHGKIKSPMCCGEDMSCSV